MSLTRKLFELLLIRVALIDGFDLAHAQQTGERLGVIIIGVHSARRLDNVLGMSSRRAEWTRILADFVRIVLEARFPIRI